MSWEGVRLQTASQKTCPVCTRFKSASLYLDARKSDKNNMKLFSSLMLSILAVCAYAQTPSDTATVRELPNVDVMAERGVGMTSSLMPVQQLNKSQMLQLNIASLSDALKHMAGITVRDYGGAGGMKTVSARGIGSRHTAVSYDGIVLSDCQSGEIDLSRYSLDNVEQMTLTIGDADDIFRPARNMASAAILELQTRPLPTENAPSPNTYHPSPIPHHPHELKVSMVYGSWGTVSPSFWYGQSLGNGWSVGASGEYLYAENDYPFTLQNVSLTTRERRSNSRMSAGHAETMATWRPNNLHQFDAKIHYNDNLRRLPGIVHYYTNLNDEQLHDRNAFMQMRYRGTPAQHWHIMANAKFNWAESDYQNHTPGSVVGDAQYWQREWYAAAAVLFETSQVFSFDYSADYLMNSLNSTIPPTPNTQQPTPNIHPHRRTIFQALSAKAQYDRLTAIARLLSTITHHPSSPQGGIRGGLPNTQHLSPSLALSYRLLPSEELLLRTSWKQTYRLPTFNELYFYHFGTNDLQPEKATQWNAGLTWHHAWKNKTECMLTTDMYYNKVSDKIVGIPFNMFVWRMMNLANVAVYGTDVTLETACQLNRRHRLSLTGNYSWQRAENRSNPQSPNYQLQIAYVPQHSFSATLSWLNPWTNLSLSADGQSHRWATNEHSDGTRIAGFVEFDVGAWKSFSWHKHKLTLRASVRNLLDKQYDIVAHYPMPGRSWRLQLTIE